MYFLVFLRKFDIQKQKADNLICANEYYSIRVHCIQKCEDNVNELFIFIFSVILCTVHVQYIEYVCWQSERREAKETPLCI